MAPPGLTVLRLLIVFLFFGATFTFAGDASEQRETALPLPDRSAERLLAWEAIEEGEAKAEAWIANFKESEILEMGRAAQHPTELELIRAFYPYLLPHGFFNLNIDLTCYPSFLDFQREKNQGMFETWEQCIRELWRDEPPAPIARALMELEP